MMNKSYLFSRLKDVKVSDYLSFFSMAFAILVSKLWYKKNKDTWLICEEPYEARDNGYHFFKYVVNYHPEQKCVYAIKKKSVDYKKVALLGNTVEYGSVRHWILYFTCQYNISSQKGGKPNAAVCSFMELNNVFKTKNIFLQHGITINNPQWLHADKCRFYKFVTSTKPEYNYILNNFGYNKDTLILTGMPRFDALHDIQTKKNRIVIMPTWRYWFNLKSKQSEDLSGDFINSRYLRAWKKLLENRLLNELIESYELEVIFYPHRNMQKYLKEMKKMIKTKVVMASWEEYDIQELLITSELMITDYSSVFFDMIYQKKPVIFYQFDLDDFRKGQYEEGYFKYDKNPFANSYKDDQDVIIALQKMIVSQYRCSEEYYSAYDEYFEFSDVNNSHRIYEILVNDRKG